MSEINTDPKAINAKGVLEYANGVAYKGNVIKASSQVEIVGS